MTHWRSTGVTRPTDDHHWLALWLLLGGGILLSLTDYESTFAGILIGAGFTWLALVD